jgi:hypothetical protein
VEREGGDAMTTKTAPKMTKTEMGRLYKKAHEAGMEAGEKVIPQPMIVFQRENPFDDTSAITKVYEPVMDGVCGFAWVVIRPGTSSFARYLKSKGLASKHYYGGVSVWVGYFNQSMTRKEAYARAFADVLREAGIDAYAGSRMD